jgi:hypothetical protein
VTNQLKGEDKGHRQIFLGTADEEVKDEGSLWMIANKSALFKDVEYL